MVRTEGLEPTNLAAPDPKSGASTNFATSAVNFFCADTIEKNIRNQANNEKN